MRKIKYLLIVLFAAPLWHACNKFEDMPETSVNERINERMEEYQTYLSAAPFGWKAYLLTKSGLQKNFTFKFDDKNRVISTLEDDASKREESSYRLKYLQRPSLLFDTYSILHKLADPNPNVYGGEWSKGMESDFEFAFMSASANRIELKGLFNESKLILIKATSEEDSKNTFVDNAKMINEIMKLRTYFKRTTIDDKEYEVDFNPGDRKFALIYYVDGFAKRIESSFYVVGNEVNFYTPLVLGTDTIKVLNDVSFNTAGYVDVKLGAVNLKITEAIEPLYYDKTAVTRFWASGRQLSFTPWVSDSKKDYLNDASITAGTGLNQRVAILGYNPAYDLMGYAADYSLYFGTAIAKTIDVNTGLIKYSFLGTVGSIPAAYRTIIIQTAQNFADPKGLYVIEKGASKYDLVTASDARKWISFGPL
ncbi:MAG: DUF4302 domain-containing protein [Sphingobacterium sp.]|nr:DUF4302 domain-containing protein [Sphingobacterium sp.]